MARVLKQSLPEPVWTDPYEAQMAAIREAMKAPVAPTYSPEEVAERRSTNTREHDLGLLGILSGNEHLAGAGGTYLKRALAQRDPRVTERGTMDQITGQFKYSPEYLRQRDEQNLTALEAKSAASRERFEAERRGVADKADYQQTQLGGLMAIAGMRAGAGGELGSGVATQVGADPTDQQPIFRNKRGELFKYANGVPVEYAGPIAPKASSATPSEDERKAAGWYQQAVNSYKGMREAVAEDSKAAAMPLKERLTTMVPSVGEDIAYQQMTPARQKYTTAVAAFSEAVLRAATGAGVNRDEALQKIRELTPRYGENPNTTAWKEQQMQMYLQSLLSRAGRAAPGGAAPGGAGAAGGGGDDPLGLRGGK